MAVTLGRDNDVNRCLVYGVALNTSQASDFRSQAEYCCFNNDGDSGYAKIPYQLVCQFPEEAQEG
ncbi:hypothetical protein EC968_007049 [Mortierella alpina]|nr:hypothetical protein EC968_007049 [Mortierella alpina]